MGKTAAQIAAVALIIVLLPWALLFLLLCVAFGVASMAVGYLAGALASASNPITGDTPVVRVAVSARKDGKIVPNEVVEVLRRRRPPKDNSDA